MVLVTEKRRTSAMYKSLAQRFASHASLEFAEVVKDSESAALLAQYGVTKAPTLLAITADRQTLTYNGGWVGGWAGGRAGGRMRRVGSTVGSTVWLLAQARRLWFALGGSATWRRAYNLAALFACPPVICPARLQGR